MTCPNCHIEQFWNGAKRCFYCGVLLASLIAPGQATPQQRPAPDLSLSSFPSRRIINVDSSSVGPVGLSTEYYRSQGMIIVVDRDDPEKSG